MANRVTQQHIEVAVVPDNQKVRATQQHIEVAVVPNNQRIRATQHYIEVAVKDSVVAPAGTAGAQVIWIG